ncbi:MAG: hypothetical protein PVH62_08005, partial [Anaerolineae bacterium]
FVADGGEDTTLVINDPNGSWRCNDDYSGLDPMVEFPNPFTGQYDIWVGSYSSGDYVNGTLYITELDYHPGNLPGPGPSTASVVLSNSSGQTICYVNISPSANTTWGDDQLGSTETIPEGGTRTFNVSPGTYDLRALDCDQNQIDVQWDANVSGPYSWIVTGGADPGPSTASVVLSNSSGQTICYVNISPSANTTWGDDQLGPTETIPVGGTRTFNVSPGTYDLRALDCDQNQINVQWDANVSGPYSWIVTD